MSEWNSTGPRKGIPAGALYALIGALVAVAALLMVIIFLLLNSGPDSGRLASADNGSSGAGAEPGTGPDFKGKRPSDIGAYGGESVLFNDVEITASAVVFNPSQGWYSHDSYCSNISITNNSADPLEVGPSDFAMRFSIGKNKTPNELNDIERLENQLIPAGGSTLGSLCYGVASVVGDRENPDFVYEGIGLGGIRIGWTPAN